MNALYKALNTSRQAFHQRRQRMLKMHKLKTQILPIIEQWRLDHPGMSIRLLYDQLRPSWIGRDRFEAFCFEEGFKVQQSTNKFKTTRSAIHNPFPNLLQDRWLTGVNQVWVSDITYFQIPKQVTYITILLDLWSRFIVGHQVSVSLHTVHSTLPALRKALQSRKPARGLILHSDGGGQYYSHQLLEVTKKHGVQNSMGRSVYENAQAERIHHTIKNQYLKHYHPGTLQELKELTKAVIFRYNFERPHASLQKRTPAQYEKLQSLPSKKIIHKTYATKTNILILK